MKFDEWLEADGLGGFASGTVSGIRTRRYHALLLAATNPPAGRLVLVNGFDASIETEAGVFAISSQMYNPDVVHPDGAHRIESFKTDPWPQWTYRLSDGTEVAFELFVPKGGAVIALSWRLVTRVKEANLRVRPFFSGRDYHSMHHENAAFRFDAEAKRERLVWHAYNGIPGVVALHNGEYRHQPDWYRNFLYDQERARGLDALEDLAAPGFFTWDLTRGEARLIFAAEGFDGGLFADRDEAEVAYTRLRTAELRRRNTFSSTRERSADAYLVRRAGGKTIVAGYPWFTDWGRDTFIALRGLCLATERLDDARDILLQWSSAVSEGMLPNRFPDHGDEPEYNSVDASLWYVVAVGEFLLAMKSAGRRLAKRDENSLTGAVQAILEGYAKGTRYNIHMADDGLLAAGVPGVQLTWMDAKVGDWVVTPRVGKPVEVEALWINALSIGAKFSAEWNQVFERALAAFRARFWNEHDGCLYDVVDVDHRSGALDASFRPNQIFAVGGLPIALLEGERAAKVVAAVESRLWTPLGLRSLAPDESGYVPRYDGGVRERDGAYHQGTVWPWLIGPFVEAWLHVHGNTVEAKQEARRRFLQPVLNHLNEAGLGHVSEIADAEAPYTPRGCPFQAWSLGEVIRLERIVLAETKTIPASFSLKAASK